MIKINIDRNKFINEKLSYGSEEDNLDNDIHKIKEQLKSHINSANNYCFLMSGYRGVGKTTIIEDLKNEIDSEKNIFVNINISKYEQHHFIMRKLIRSLYEEYISKTKNSILNLFGNRKKFKRQIELLYDRTFYEVTKINSIKRQLNLDINIDIKSTMQTVIKLAIAIASLMITIKYDLNKNITNKNLLELLLTIWCIFETSNLLIGLKYNNHKLNEINRKSLYDDEIAEIKLRETLDELRKLNFNVTIVLDELDKIDNEEEMNKILSELKPLFLSNLSNFIVISGQRLYYKIYNSKTIDDALISNIFTNNIHIPLSKQDSLYRLIDKCIYKDDIENKEIENIKINYINSVILKSNTTLRGFKNIILQDIKFAGEESYIEISEYKKSKIETDSKVLKAIIKVIKKGIDNYDDDIVIKDFFTYQLYLWGKKIQLVGRYQFTKDEIFNFEEEYGKDYPYNCKNKLEELLSDLLNELASEDIKLMEREYQGTKENPTYLYRWLDEVEISEESEMEYISNIKKNFVDDFILVERYLKGIYLSIHYKNKKIIPTYTIIDDLHNLKIITESQFNDLNIYRNLRNNIVHGEPIQDDSIGIMKKANKNIYNMIDYFLEAYLCYLCKRYFDQIKYKIIVDKIESNNIFDIIVSNNDQNGQSFYFITKRIRRNTKKGYTYMITELLDSIYRDRDSHEEKDTIVVLLYIDKFTDEFLEYINEYVHQINSNNKNIKIYNIVHLKEFNIYPYIYEIMLENTNDVKDITMDRED
ncbi:hypothetical protein NE452_04580 [Paeniclostridium sordellii]|uniref:hypothetical protein n=1 Tax=Paraclostridium sordellii TaxID=1505 RepID=UPI00210BCF0B|nr:hypothetical protein [Paeniclostridium sordellii]MCQ4696790.1 hypothetical protein [Paeniclostridium sordellii]